MPKELNRVFPAFASLYTATRVNGEVFLQSSRVLCCTPTNPGKHNGIKTLCALHHANKMEKVPYPICVSRSGSVQHRCGGGWSGSALLLEWPFAGGWVPTSGLKDGVHSAFHRWSAQSAALLLLSSDELVNSCAPGTNGCLDVRCHALPPGGQVSGEWSSCPRSMTRRARDSVVPLLRSSQRCCLSTPAQTSKPPQECAAWS